MAVIAEVTIVGHDLERLVLTMVEDRELVLDELGMIVLEGPELLVLSSILTLSSILLLSSKGVERLMLILLVEKSFAELKLELGGLLSRYLQTLGKPLHILPNNST